MYDVWVYADLASESSAVIVKSNEQEIFFLSNIDYFRSEVKTNIMIIRILFIKQLYYETRSVSASYKKINWLSADKML